MKTGKNSIAPVFMVLSPHEDHTRAYNLPKNVNLRVKKGTVPENIFCTGACSPGHASPFSGPLGGHSTRTDG